MLDCDASEGSISAAGLIFAWFVNTEFWSGCCGTMVIKISDFHARYRISNVCELLGFYYYC